MSDKIVPLRPDQPTDRQQPENEMSNTVNDPVNAYIVLGVVGMISGMVAGLLTDFEDIREAIDAISLIVPEQIHSILDKVYAEHNSENERIYTVLTTTTAGGVTGTLLALIYRAGKALKRLTRKG